MLLWFDAVGVGSVVRPVMCENSPCELGIGLQCVLHLCWLYKFVCCLD